MTKLKIFSMFTGIGGFELGITKALGEDNVEIVGYSEINKYALQIYKKHFGGYKNYGDITKIKPEELPDFDLLVGGVPCQSWSIAGKRKGFKDVRGTMWFEVFRIAKIKKPKMLLLENVRGLLSHDGGRSFAKIITKIRELGYNHIEWRVFNSKYFGVAQNRKRIFIVACFGKQIKQVNNPVHSNNRVYSSEGVSPCLNTAQGGNRQPNIVMPVCIPKRLNKLQNGRRFKNVGELSQDRHGVVICHSLYPRSSKTGKGGTGHLSKNDCTSYCLDTGNNMAVEKDFKIRRLTPMECERLQSFPDNFTMEGVDDNGNVVQMSDSQRYKCLGNAVTVNVVESIMSVLGGFLGLEVVKK